MTTKKTCLAVPNESGLWWHWNEDEDSAPYAVAVMYSGTSDTFFAPANQHGWTRAQECSEMGGRWIKAEEPALTDFGGTVFKLPPSVAWDRAKSTDYGVMQIVGPLDALKVYIAGPMTGLPGKNFSTFDAAEAVLRQRGYAVINPATLTRDDPRTDTFKSRGEEKYYCYRRDLLLLLRCDFVVVLNGWEGSEGARLEVQTARGVGMPVIELQDVIAERCTLRGNRCGTCGTEIPGCVKPCGPCLNCLDGTGTEPEPVNVEQTIGALREHFRKEVSRFVGKTVTGELIQGVQRQAASSLRALQKRYEQLHKLARTTPPNGIEIFTILADDARRIGLPIDVKLPGDTGVSYALDVRVDEKDAMKVNVSFIPQEIELSFVLSPTP